MVNFLVFGCVLYLGLLAGLYFLQRQMIYHPEPMTGGPETYELVDTVAQVIDTQDNVNVTLWYHQAKPGFPTVIYFHGNAGNLGGRAAKLKIFADAGLGFVGLCYRGYGNCGGSPSEEGIYHDARAAIEYAEKILKIPPTQLILFGESLGSGVAVQMATEYQVGLLVLEAPYTSITNRSAELYPYIPVRLLLKDKFESINKIKNVKTPLLIIHGEKDMVIPAHHGRTLLEAANEPKRGVFYPQVGHSDFTGAQLLDPLLAFAREQGMVKN